jgi:hypothetical protein
VLEALREGRELTAKEKTIHTQGPVGILKELHDELDTAVLQAYGWADLQAIPADTPELLTRLVALNARRAAEEKTGLVRWLRPEFQNPTAAKSLSNSEQYHHISRGLKANIALSDSGGLATPLATAPSTAQPWPATLPEQVRAVAQLLASAATALPLSALEASFKGRGPWKKSLPRILETLEALGRARRVGADWIA